MRDVNELYCTDREANETLSYIILMGKYYATYSAMYVGPEGEKKYRQRNGKEKNKNKVPQIKNTTCCSSNSKRDGEEYLHFGIG